MKLKRFFFISLSPPFIITPAREKNKINFILTLDIVSFPKSSYCFSALILEKKDEWDLQDDKEKEFLSCV